MDPPNPSKGKPPEEDPNEAQKAMTLFNPADLGTQPAASSDGRSAVNPNIKFEPKSALNEVDDEETNSESPSDITDDDFIKHGFDGLTGKQLRDMCRLYPEIYSVTDSDQSDQSSNSSVGTSNPNQSELKLGSAVDVTDSSQSDLKLHSAASNADHGQSDPKLHSAVGTVNLDQPNPKLDSEDKPTKSGGKSKRLGKQVEGIQKRVDRMETNIQKINARMDALALSQTELDEELRSVENNVLQMMRKLDQLEEKTEENIKNAKDELKLFIKRKLDSELAATNTKLLHLH